MRTPLSASSWIAFIVLLLCSSASAAPSPAAQHETKPVKTSKLGIFNVQGLPNVECGSTNSGASTKCDGGVKWKVQVFRVTDDAGTEKGCLTSFGYNDLNVRTSKDQEETSVTWVLPSDGSGGKFIGSGIEITKGNTGDSPGALFGTPKISADGYSVSLAVKKKIQGNKKFNHQAVVQVPGVPTCLGVDPTIGNSAD